MLIKITEINQNFKDLGVVSGPQSAGRLLPTPWAKRVVTLVQVLGRQLGTVESDRRRLCVSTGRRSETGCRISAT